MRKVLRVAVYRPLGSAEGSHTAGLDEDPFTMAVTAVERVWAESRADPGPVVAHLLGDLPSVADWGLAPILGRDVVVSRVPGDSHQLSRSLRELEEGEGGDALVVAVDLAPSTAGETSTRSRPDAGAVAYLLVPTEEARVFPIGKGSAGRSAVTATLRLGEAGHDPLQDVTLVGDWERPRATGGTSERRDDTEEGRLAAVSEGAYVPKARYLENLPSRWRFLAEACGACHHTTFPARRVCRNCGRQDSLTPVELPLDGGRVVAVTTVGAGGQPTEFDAQVASSGPYDVALVELARGMRVTLQVTDSAPGTLRVGDHVNTFLRRLYPMEGEWRYGRKAVPLDSRAATPAGPSPR